MNTHPVPASPCRLPILIDSISCVRSDPKRRSSAAESAAATTAGSEAAEAACEARLEARGGKLCLCASPQCQSQGMLARGMGISKNSKK